jgi:thioredoxin reductase
VGGKTRLHALLPGGESLSSIYDYQQLAAKRAGVKFELGVAATAADVLALRPDAVVLATGSTPSWPDFLPAEYRGEGVFPDIREAAATLVARTTREPGTAVIYDRDHGAFTYATAEMLLKRFERVVLVTPRAAIAQDEPLVNRQGIMRRVYGKGIEVIVLSEIVLGEEFADGAIVARNVFSGRETRIDDVALLTYATARLPNDALAEPLRAAGLEVHLAGDCYAPRSVLTATTEGHRVGNQL